MNLSAPEGVLVGFTTDGPGNQTTFQKRESLKTKNDTFFTTRSAARRFKEMDEAGRSLTATPA